MLLLPLLLLPLGMVAVSPPSSSELLEDAPHDILPLSACSLCVCKGNG